MKRRGSRYAVLPEFVFADVDVGVPGDSVAAKHDVHLSKQAGVVERLKDWQVKQRLDIVVLDHAVIEADPQHVVVERLDRGYQRGLRIRAHSSGGRAMNSCVSQICSKDSL